MSSLQITVLAFVAFYLRAGEPVHIMYHAVPALVVHITGKASPVDLGCTKNAHVLFGAPKPATISKTTRLRNFEFDKSHKIKQRTNKTNKQTNKQTNKNKKHKLLSTKLQYNTKNRQKTKTKKYQS